MTTGIEQEFTRYRTERPIYEHFVERLQNLAKSACRKAGLRCTVTGRAKTIESFAKKLLTKPQSYDDVYDKAGIRIVPTYPDDRQAVARVVEDTFAVSWRKDFSEVTDVKTFDYRGLHFTVGLPASGDVSIDEHAGLVAELQVHRPGEALWATINHDLFYKSRIKASPGLHRSMHRLSALLELVDVEMATIRTQLLEGPDADVARIVETIEVDFLRLRGIGFNDDLTTLIVRALRPAMGELSSFLPAYSAFVASNTEKLLHVFSEYADDFQHLLLSQPEALLIFYLSEFDQPGLEQHWPSELPQSMLEGLGDVWVPAN